MRQDSGAVPTDAQRAELARLVEVLGGSSRLARLLQYIGEKFFARDLDHLNEYNIATEVFGRSKTTFDPGQDAIARVEVHRLRKRLKEYYESEGRDHPIQLAFPSGCYVPQFVAVSKALEALSSEPVLEGPEQWKRFSIQLKRWKYVLLIAVVFFLGLLGFLYFRYTAKRTHSAVISKPGSVPAPLSTDSTPLPIRILAGYSGTPRIDSTGATWSPDKYFVGGSAWRHTPDPIARTSDPFIFENSRNGDFYYQIPLKPGFYEVHLFFVAPSGSTGTLGTFLVMINGEVVLGGFDVNVDALGENIADERVFRGVSPGPDGFLRIDFKGEIAPPTVNAIEILPGLPHSQLPIRLVMQTTPLTDSSGQQWHPDSYFMNGRLSTRRQPVTGSSDPDLFSGERYGHFTYAIPVDPRGRYTLVLHFAEFYFGSGASGTGGAGSRLFKVMCNGQTLLDDLDVYKEAGSNLRVVTRTFRRLKPSAQGKLNLTFEPIRNNATISAIEVLDESE